MIQHSPGEITNKNRVQIAILYGPRRSGYLVIDR